MYKRLLAVSLLLNIQFAQASLMPSGDDVRRGAFFGTVSFVAAGLSTWAVNRWTRQPVELADYEYMRDGVRGTLQDLDDSEASSSRKGEVAFAARSGGNSESDIERRVTALESQIGEPGTGGVGAKPVTLAGIRAILGEQEEDAPGVLGDLARMKKQVKGLEDRVTGVAANHTTLADEVRHKDTGLAKAHVLVEEQGRAHRDLQTLIDDAERGLAAAHSKAGAGGVDMASFDAEIKALSSRIGTKVGTEAHAKVVRRVDALESANLGGSPQRRRN